ncbi:MAG: phospholipase, partial [Anaerolineae bacterium]|nr:phospholipase [Anaerolineae bacterium]
AVRGIFETRGSETEFSEFAQMKRQNLDVRQDGNPYTLHHKVFIIDNQVVTLGSFNFSDNANRANDENMLIIHNPDIAAEFLAEFDRNYTLAQNAIQ